MPTHVRIGHPKEANYDQSIDIWRKKQIGYLKSTGPREYPSHSRVWSFFEPIIKSHTTTSRQKYKTLPIRFTGSGNFTSLNKFFNIPNFRISRPKKYLVRTSLLGGYSRWIFWNFGFFIWKSERGYKYGWYRWGKAHRSRTWGNKVIRGGLGSWVSDE